MAPQISGQDVSKSRTKQEPDLQYGKRERKEPRLGRPFYLVKILQLRAGRRKGRRSAVVRNLVSGYRREWSSAISGLVTSHFPLAAKKSFRYQYIIKHEVLPGTHSAPRPYPLAVSASVTTQLYTIRCVLHHSISTNCSPLLLQPWKSRRG
jgi:hypothetical protein